MKKIKETFAAARRRISSSPDVLFAAAVFLSLCVWFIFVLVKGQLAFNTVFFNRCGDTFMDFFNSIRDASQGEAAYTERNVIYPPMANLIYLVLSRFLPPKYLDTTFKKRLTWVNDTTSVMFVLLCHLVLILLLFWLVYRRLKGSDGRKFCVAFTCVFSVPILYTVERGNLLLLCTVLMCIYAGTYDSESRWKREVGLLALALAFSVKLYPAVFGWFLLTDKRYKDALRCALYGVAFFVLPSFFFGGPSVFLQILSNIRAFSSTKVSVGTIGTIAMTAGIPQELLTLGAYLNIALLAIFAAASPFLFRGDRIRQWTFGLCAILSVPSLTSVYGWTLFLPVLIWFFAREEKMCGYDWFLFALIGLPYLVLPGRFNYYLSLNQLLLYVCLTVLDLTLLCDGVLGAFRFFRKIGTDRREKKKNSVSEVSEKGENV